MPSTTVQKMIGAINILISLMKPSASGLRAEPKSGQTAPTTMPATIATSNQVNIDRYHGVFDDSTGPSERAMSVVIAQVSDASGAAP